MVVRLHLIIEQYTHKLFLGRLQLVQPARHGQILTPIMPPRDEDDVWGGKSAVCLLMYSGDGGEGHWVAYAREEGGPWYRLDSATTAAAEDNPFLVQVGSRRNAKKIGLMMFK